jgi:hypothetical protein
MSDRLVFALDLGNGKSAELYESTDYNPELHVDGIQGMLVNGATVKLNFFSRIYPTVPDVERRQLVCRMVMGVDTFLSVADYFKQYAEKLQRDLNIQILPTDR